MDPFDPELTASRSGDPADPRYANRDERGWGIRAFAQDPDEFLGGPTDDDAAFRHAPRPRTSTLLGFQDAI